MWSEKGQTLLELVVVVAVIVLIVGALVFAAISSLRNAGFAKNQAQATKLAQEGLEKVRGGRDRNQCIVIGTSVNSWNGGNSNCQNSGSLWQYEIYNNCGSGVAGTACYFKINSSGVLDYIGSWTTFPDAFAEDVYGDGSFRRALILEDNSASYQQQKTATIIVQWRDFSGAHESKLSTVLRRIE